MFWAHARAGKGGAGRKIDAESEGLESESMQQDWAFIRLMRSRAMLLGAYVWCAGTCA